MLHLHRLQHQHRVTRGDLLALLDHDLHDAAGHRREQRTAGHLLGRVEEPRDAHQPAMPGRRVDVDGLAPRQAGDDAGVRRRQSVPLEHDLHTVARACRDPQDAHALGGVAVPAAPPLHGEHVVGRARHGLELRALRLARHVAERHRDAVLHRAGQALGLGHRDGSRERSVGGLDARSLALTARPPRQERRAHAARHEVGVGEDRDELVAVGDQAVDAGTPQHPRQLAAGLLARRRVHHHLGQHRVVERRHLAAGDEPAVDADPRLLGDLERGQDARLRLVVGGRVLGVEPDLDRVTVGSTGVSTPGRRWRSSLLDRRETTALGDGQLHLDQVHAVHQLGDRVLDLEAGVHLQEEEPVGVLVVEELHGAGAAVVDGRGRGPRGLMQRLAGGLRQRRGRRLLDHLLVPPLDRAVALPQHQHVARAVADDLDLDVPAALDVRLDEDGAVAERRRRLLARLPDLALEVGERPDDAHAAPAAARRRLHQQRQVGLRG